MATFKLKNDSKDSGMVPGVGNYVDGVLRNAPETFENPNFEKVVEAAQTESAPAQAAPAAPVAPAVLAPAPAPSPVAPVQAPVANTQTEGDK